MLHKLVLKSAFLLQKKKQWGGKLGRFSIKKV